MLHKFPKTCILAKRTVSHKFIPEYPPHDDMAILKLLLSLITIFIYLLVKEASHIMFNDFWVLLALFLFNLISYIK